MGRNSPLFISVSTAETNIASSLTHANIKRDIHAAPSEKTTNFHTVKTWSFKEAYRSAWKIKQTVHRSGITMTNCRHELSRLASSSQIVKIITKHFACFLNTVYCGIIKKAPSATMAAIECAPHSSALPPTNLYSRGHRPPPL